MRWHRYCQVRYALKHTQSIDPNYRFSLSLLIADKLSIVQHHRKFRWRKCERFSRNTWTLRRNTVTSPRSRKSNCLPPTTSNKKLTHNWKLDGIREKILTKSCYIFFINFIFVIKIKRSNYIWLFLKITCLHYSEYCLYRLIEFERNFMLAQMSLTHPGHKTSLNIRFPQKNSYSRKHKLLVQQKNDQH